MELIVFFIAIIIAYALGFNEGMNKCVEMSLDIIEKHIKELENNIE